MVVSAWYHWTRRIGSSQARGVKLGSPIVAEPVTVARAARMKRRVFTKAFFFGLVCSQALAADPLPTLRETPMFAEQVKSGALPPVAKRIPEQPWVVKRFPGDDGPGQPGGQLNMLVAKIGRAH